jgi:hypothetical protein
MVPRSDESFSFGEEQDTFVKDQNAPTTTTRPTTINNDDDSTSSIRKRFLHRLGIEKEEIHVSSRNRLLLSRPAANRYKVTIKGDFGAEDKSVRNKIHVDPGSISGKTCTVCFHVSVAVQEIPSHRSYSDRIRLALWTPGDELAEQCARNCVEFAYENYNWQTVCEDFVPFGNEWIHPCHLQRRPCVRRQFLYGMLQREREQLYASS